MIIKLKTERGLSLQDLITEAYQYVETIDFPAPSRVYLLDFLATTEYVHVQWRDLDVLTYRRYRLSTGGSEKIQLSALLAAFKNAVQLSHRK